MMELLCTEELPFPIEDVPKLLKSFNDLEARELNY